MPIRPNDKAMQVLGIVSEATWDLQKNNGKCGITFVVEGYPPY